MIKYSPILYTGSKRRLIEKHNLIDFFPKDIDNFCEPFAGSAIISMNTNANHYFLNDLNSNVVDMLKWFKNTNPNDIVNCLNDLVKYYDLDTDMLDSKRHPTQYHKTQYNKLRDDFNKDKTRTDLLYCLLIYSFSHQIRFNQKNEFNMPAGNGWFNDEIKNKILNCDFFEKDVYITNKSFRDLDVSFFDKNDFVYLDPPYNNTTTTYNEGDGWTNKDENDLYTLLEKLDDNGVKWAMSNVFANKDFVNTKLIDWCSGCSWNVHEFEDFTYCTNGKGNARTKEVLIRNY